MNLKRIGKWLLVFCWCAVIFFSSNQQGLSSGFSFDFILRKFAHVFVFTVLFILVFWALRNSKVSVKRSAVAACIFSILYAISDEVHQSFIPTRHGSPIDVGIDIIGITVLFLWLLLRKKKRKRKFLK